MTQLLTVETERLLLRQWHDSDLAVFAEINADETVMAYYPSVLTRAASDQLADTIIRKMQLNNWGFFAVELKQSKGFIGFVGLNQPDYSLPFAPCVEIGWRLSKHHWGQGYASEAARAVVKFGFTELSLTEIVSFTSVLNLRSIKLMQRLGMTHSERYFNHPKLHPGHRLEKHCLYQLSKVNWQKKDIEM